MKKKEYDANMSKAVETFGRRKEKYVQQELQIYYQQVKAIEEEFKWGRSPLYSLLNRYHLQNGFQCPWEHTKEGLEIIIEELEKELKPFSLDKACRHIVRAFKLFCKALFGRQHPLAHPNKGLTQHTILHYVHEQTHFMRLTIDV